MNTVDTITARINKRMLETKNPCKSYSTKEAAEKATKKMAEIATEEFRGARTTEYVVFFHEKLNRWVGAVDMTRLFANGGGYACICSHYNFYSY